MEIQSRVVQRVGKVDPSASAIPKILCKGDRARLPRSVTNDLFPLNMIRYSIISRLGSSYYPVPLVVKLIFDCLPGGGDP